jgi:hypothetical protein
LSGVASKREQRISRRVEISGRLLAALIEILLPGGVTLRVDAQARRCAGCYRATIWMRKSDNQGENL